MTWNILDIVKSGDFLPHVRKVTSDWCSSDSPELYAENLVNQPADWYWRNKTVRYTLNSSRYRCPDWQMIDWSKSIVMFGCSQVFGVGVDDKDTIPYILSQILGIPVINLGVSGSSMIFSFHNALQYHAGARPIPLGVVNLWTSSCRTTTYHENWIEYHGPWNADQGNEFDLFNKHLTHTKITALQIERSSQLIWQNTKYYSASLFADTANAIDCVDLTVACNATYNSRDQIHTDPDSNLRIAEYIANTGIFSL